MPQNEPYGLYRQEKNTMPRIEGLYAFVSVDAADGNEGVMAVQIGDSWMPLIAADPERLKALRPLAEDVVKITRKAARLVRFTGRVDMEEINP